MCDAVAHCRGGRAVHDGVLAHDAGLAVVEDNELHGLVDPAVAQAEDGLATGACHGTVPEPAAVLDEGGWLLGIEAQDESGRFDSFENGDVLWLLGESSIILLGLFRMSGVHSVEEKYIPWPKRRGLKP